MIQFNGTKVMFQAGGEIKKKKFKYVTKILIGTFF